jgi:hypothetical protein
VDRQVNSHSTKHSIHKRCQSRVDIFDRSVFVFLNFFAYGQTLVMKLKMFIAGVLVDSASVNILQLKNEDYILRLKSRMEDENADIIDLTDEEPSFYIDEVPSRMNLLSELIQN